MNETLISVDMVKRDDLIAAIPEHMKAHTGSIIFIIYGDKSELPTRELMRELYGIISFDDYEKIIDIITTEM